MRDCLHAWICIFPRFFNVCGELFACSTLILWVHHVCHQVKLLFYFIANLFSILIHSSSIQMLCIVKSLIHQHLYCFRVLALVVKCFWMLCKSSFAFITVMLFVTCLITEKSFKQLWVHAQSKHWHLWVQDHGLYAKERAEEPPRPPVKANDYSSSSESSESSEESEGGEGAEEEESSTDR